MNKFKAVITLIRLPNLVFILLTQLLTYYAIILPAVLSAKHVATLSTFYVALLCLSTVLIAAAGYIINDYFDIGIDAINKPEKVTIEKVFKRRTIIIWHITLNVVAIMIAAFIAFYYVQLRLLTIQLICILLLIFYSTTFKRKLIVGNFSIAILTSLTLVTMAIYEPQFELFNIHFQHTKLLWVYIFFSFIITFIREIVKDIEDVKGDTAQHCETIPLVWGIATAKHFTYLFIAFLMLLLIITGWYFMSFNLVLVFFLGLTVFIPIVYVSVKISKALTSHEFHAISTYIKIITLFGILSMLLI